MPLPKDYKNQLMSKLKEKGIRADCEICGQNNWSIVDQAISVNVTDLSHNVIIPSPFVPSAGMICNNCGNIRLFSLIALGIKFDQEKEGDK